jgi:FtsH-binding integral membrane protein
MFGQRNATRGATERTSLSEGQSQWIKNATVEVRLGFVRKVYSLLSVQLLITFAIAYPLQNMSAAWRLQNQWLMGVSCVVTIGTLCAMMCCRDVCRQFPTNYFLLFGFTIFEGIMIGFVSAAYTKGSVAFCVAITAAIFIALTIYAWTTTTDFTGMGAYIFGALMGFCMFGMAMWIMGMAGLPLPPGMMMMYNLCGVMIFTMYIVFDTQMILGEYGGHQFQFSVDDYVFAALTLYLDIINLFLYLLRLFGQRK